MGYANIVLTPGQSDFVSNERTAGRNPPQAGSSGTADPVAPGKSPGVGLIDPSLPGGHVAGIEEGDIHRIVGNQLYYLNTYRGLLIYDLTDPKQPLRLARVPVFGYPVEMYVVANTIHVLLRDILHLTQVGGKAQFERRHVSQLASLDITDRANPKVLGTIDIRGKVLEGATRKVGDTIYVVSVVPRPWETDVLAGRDKEQAWVQSFNVANPQGPQKVGEHKIFEGGSTREKDATGKYHLRDFNGLVVSAASSTMMVAESWDFTDPTPGTESDVITGTPWSCLDSYTSSQRSHITLIDIGDPGGAFKSQKDFWIEGRIADQSKITTRVDPASKRASFFAVLTQQTGVSANGSCSATPVKSRLESWDVTHGRAPVRLSTLELGTDKTPGGSAFDLDRQLAYVAMASGDSFYALDLSKPDALRVMFQGDGQFGDLSAILLRDNHLLLGVGGDNGGSCGQGSGPGQAQQSGGLAITLIDAGDPTRIRLVQRQCGAVRKTDVPSMSPSNSDHLRKRLATQLEGTLNILALPLSYTHIWESAIGLMSWDMSRHNPALPPDQQTVIQNHGTFVHPRGDVLRSILFRHESPAGSRRLMVNLSDTHVSVVDVQDLATPTLQADTEVARFLDQVHRFGDLLVEQVQPTSPISGSAAAAARTSFRIKKSGGDVEGAPVLKTLEVDKVVRVLKHTDSLVVFRQLEDARMDAMGVYHPAVVEAQIVDFRNPAEARLAGKLLVPTPVPTVPSGMYTPFDYVQEYVSEPEPTAAFVERGFAFQAFATVVEVQGQPGSVVNKIVFLDLRDPDAPTISEAVLPSEPNSWVPYGFIADPVDPKGFFLSRRMKAGEIKIPDGSVFTQYRYVAQRWEPDGNGWAPRYQINIPGRLLRTFQNANGERHFLSQDMTYKVAARHGTRYWMPDPRLALSRQVPGAAAGAEPAAQLLDSRILLDLLPTSLVVEGDKVLLSARPRGVEAVDPTRESSSDRLLIIDMAANQLTLSHNQPTLMFNARVFSAYRNHLYLNLGPEYQTASHLRRPIAGGDGVLVLDINNPASPKAVRLVRTVGLVNQIAFFGDDVYVVAGPYGLSHFNLATPPTGADDPFAAQAVIGPADLLSSTMSERTK
jgi:hypothetical protein